MKAPTEGSHGSSRIRDDKERGEQSPALDEQAYPRQAAVSHDAPPTATILRRHSVRPETVSSQHVLHLQRIIGNRSVTQLLQAKRHTGPSGAGDEQREDRGALPVAATPAPSVLPGTVQRQVDDENDALQMKPLVQRDEEEETSWQRGFITNWKEYDAKRYPTGDVATRVRWHTGRLKNQNVELSQGRWRHYGIQWWQGANPDTEEQPNAPVQIGGHRWVGATPSGERQGVPGVELGKHRWHGATPSNDERGSDAELGSHRVWHGATPSTDERGSDVELGSHRVWHGATPSNEERESDVELGSHRVWHGATPSNDERESDVEIGSHRVWHGATPTGDRDTTPGIELGKQRWHGATPSNEERGSDVELGSHRVWHGATPSNEERESDVELGSYRVWHGATPTGDRQGVPGVELGKQRWHEATPSEGVAQDAGFTLGEQRTKEFQNQLWYKQRREQSERWRQEAKDRKKAEKKREKKQFVANLKNTVKAGRLLTAFNDSFSQHLSTLEESVAQGTEPNWALISKIRRTTATLDLRLEYIGAGFKQLHPIEYARYKRYKARFEKIMAQIKR